MTSVRWRYLLVALVAFLLPLIHTTPTDAISTPSKPRGLFITPVKLFVTVEPGSVRKGSLTVANMTDKQTVVTMSVERFFVQDYSYNYVFSAPEENWITMDAPQFTLRSGETKQVTYTITMPKGLSPGGYYFTFFASTVLSGGASTATVRAATVAYITALGSLQYTSDVKKESIPQIVLGGDIEFSLDVKNTGNAHFFTYTSGRLDGWMTRSQGEERTNLLLPGTQRTIGNTIPAPLLPGIYQASYGYRTDHNATMQRTKLILYLPLWSVSIPFGVAALALLYKKVRRTRNQTNH